MPQAVALQDPATRPAQPAPRGEPGLVFGRPLEDRSFEAVEAGVGLIAGLAIGSAVAGPVGAGVGAVIGTLSGIVAGEAVERAVGRAATTTDASEPEPPPEA